jgi:hypothetical protein
MSKQIYDDALHVMEVQGGSFVKALANCYYMADQPNKAILRQAFAKYFDGYEARFSLYAERAATPTHCSECGSANCGGECMGDGLMGGSS